MLYTEYDARAALGLAPVNYFTDALGNVSTPPATAGNTTPTMKPTNWGLWLSVAGVAFAALTYFKGR